MSVSITEKNKKDQGPIVSIVVPVYNYGSRIKLCMASILEQSYRHLELIVIDDGSSDDSWEEILKMAVTDKRVRAYTHLNRGVAYTRNLGIQKSTGDMLLFVDADDQLNPLFLEKTVPVLMDSGPNSFIYTQYEMRGDVERISNCGEYSLERLKVRNFVGICALHWIDHVKHVKFDSALSMDEDYDFILSVAKKGIKGVLVDEVLVHKYQHEQSRNSMGQFGLQCYETRKRIVKNHHDLFSKEEAQATLYNARMAGVRAIKSEKNPSSSLKDRLGELIYLLRFSRSPKDWIFGLVRLLPS